MNSPGATDYPIALHILVQLAGSDSVSSMLAGERGGLSSGSLRWSHSLLTFDPFKVRW